MFWKTFVHSCVTFPHQLTLASRLCEVQHALRSLVILDFDFSKGRREFATIELFGKVKVLNVSPATFSAAIKAELLAMLRDKTILIGHIPSQAAWACMLELRRALPSVNARILAMPTEALLMFDDQLRCSRWLLNHMPRHACAVYHQPRAGSIVKRRFSMGSAGVVLLPTAADCSAYLARHEYDPERDVVQQLVPRTDGGGEWKVLVFADAGVLYWRSHMRFHTTQPALLYTPDVTIMRAHEIELPTEVERLADDFVRTARWTGVAILDIMLREGAPPVIIEVNPRFSVAFPQSSASVVDMLLLLVNRAVVEAEEHKARTWWSSSSLTHKLWPLWI